MKITFFNVIVEINIVISGMHFEILMFSISVLVLPFKYCCSIEIEHTKWAHKMNSKKKICQWLIIARKKNKKLKLNYKGGIKRFSGSLVITFTRLFSILCDYLHRCGQSSGFYRNGCCNIRWMQSRLCLTLFLVNKYIQMCNYILFYDYWYRFIF